MLTTWVNFISCSHWPSNNHQIFNHVTFIPGNGIVCRVAMTWRRRPESHLSFGLRQQISSCQGSIFWSCWDTKPNFPWCSKLCQGCFCIIFLQITTPRRGQSPSTGTYPLRIWESSQWVTPKIDIRMHVLRSETDGKDLQTSDWKFPTLFYLILAYCNDWTLTFFTWIYLQ